MNVGVRVVACTGVKGSVWGVLPTRAALSLDTAASWEVSSTLFMWYKCGGRERGVIFCDVKVFFEGEGVGVGVYECG